MTPNPVVPAQQRATGTVFGLMPVHGYDIAAAVVLRMLDGEDGRGRRARGLQPGEPVPFGVRPVLLTPSTVFGTVLVETIVRTWPANDVSRPWLVVAADVPARPAAAARYRLRALSGRLAGVAYLPYLPALRVVERPEDAFEDKAVCRAAAELRARLEGK
ncbi:hypothetical protein [Kitasatospora brasiliensis]|uniref:hypothetical protein n=1 Tax=Kitasatospora brasiliensis TaxID=3058040 RepID=UPI00292F6813|nr:hypothetical protein [Kitasatospora sp. K002]